MPLIVIDKRICLMKIQQKDWLIGSLLSADSNSQSFHSHNWHSGSKRRPSPEPTTGVGDSVSIGTHTAFGSLNDSATASVGNAMTLSQTKDGFLLKVQESLQRMSELSVLAQGDSKSDTDRLTYATEFSQLQIHVKDLSAKMFKAVNLFQSTGPLTLNLVSTSLAEHGASLPASKNSMDACFGTTSDLSVTTITNAKNACEAIPAIDNALKAVKDMRVAMSGTIDRLSDAGEQLAALSEHLSRSKRWIKDMSVAEQSTRFARQEILVQSGTAMLAQANALPQSAFRLLD
ncbi:MAG: hypothetical protein EXS30_12425 [Pedosphaera sp.]|nr:hypothetical protein [Pedosphaera sp.]